jgi:hypothetical protein
MSNEVRIFVRERTARRAVPTQDRSINSGLWFPFEMLNRFGWREPFSGLRSRQSGVRYGSSGSGMGAGLNLYLVLNTRPRDLMAETWDLRIHSGFPLSELNVCRLCRDAVLSLP